MAQLALAPLCGAAALPRARALAARASAASVGSAGPRGLGATHRPAAPGPRARGHRPAGAGRSRALLVQANMSLPVPFYSQRDNYTQSGRTCNTSSCAMCLKYFIPHAIGDAFTADDEYLHKVLALGDSTDHGVQTSALHGYGLDSTWHTNLDFDVIDNELAQHRPMVIGILHKGPESAPTGGHMIVVRGRTGSGYICNDPYGSCNTGYAGNANEGNGVVYSREMLTRRWTADGRNTGWGRTFSASAPGGGGGGGFNPFAILGALGGGGRGSGSKGGEALAGGKGVRTSADTYAVEPGDCLSGIADSLSVSVKDLMKANPHITDPNGIAVGDELNIPPNAKY